MDERLLQERQFMEQAEFLGVDYPSLYMCKSKRGIKREDGGKDAYKLPHRLIEKKRRDRINECIGQLKDLLPEHLKLSTLGHLEKAVVLELTLKHLNALTAVTEQQHQKIIALQNGDRSIKPSSLHADLDAFHSGFQACAKEVLQYLSQFENWAAREQRCAQLVAHLHKVMAHLQSGTAQQQQQHLLLQQHHRDAPQDAHRTAAADGQANCVPVIQRTQGGELNETDTDTDSGYGGEAEKGEGKEKDGGGGKAAQGAKAVKVKQEFGDDERAAKKAKLGWSGSGSGPGGADLAFMNSLMGISSAGQQQQQHQPPICMPFYFINPSAAASYLPFFDKNSLEKLMYPSAAALSPFPWLYPAAFPGLTAHLASSPPSSSSSSSPSSSSSSPSSSSSQPKDAALLAAGSHEAEPGSPEEELEDSPASEDGDGDVGEASRESSASSREQFPAACQTS